MRTFVSLALLLLWGIVLCLGVLGYALSSNSAAQIISSRLSGVGRQVTLEEAQLAFFPYPGLRLAGLLVRFSSPAGQDFSLYAENCIIHLSWRSLLSGKFHLTSVTLLEPTGILTFGNDSKTSQEHSNLDMFSDLKVTLVNGQLELRYGEKLRLTGIDGELVLPNFAENSASFMHLRLAQLRTKDLCVKNVNMSFDNMRFSKTFPLLDQADMRLSANMTPLFDPEKEKPCLLILNAHLNTISQGTTLTGDLRLHGELPIKKHLTPTDLHVPFTLEPGIPDPTAALSGALTEALSGTKVDPKKDLSPASPILRIDDAKITIDSNTLLFNGRFFPGRLLSLGMDAEPRLEGKIEVKHLSLPRWFGFARDLPDGICRLLNTLDGKADISLTQQQLDLKNMQLSSGKIRMTGSGGIANLAKPVIKLQLQGSTLDATELMPSLNKVPTYTMLPIIESDDTPRKPDDVDFDIQLAANQIKFWKLSGNGVRCFIKPFFNKQDSGTQVDFTVNTFYKGKLNIGVSIGREKRIVAHAKDFDVETPLTLFSGKQVLGGMMSINVDLSKNGKFGSSIAEIASQFHGSVGMNLKDGFYMNHQPIKKASLDFNGQGTPATKTALPYSGDWRLAIATPDLETEVRFTGNIDFSVQDALPLSTNLLPCRLSFAWNDWHFTGVSKLSGNRKNLTVKDISGDLQYISAKKSAAIIGGFSVIQDEKAKMRTLGKIKISAQNLRDVLYGFIAQNTLNHLPQEALRLMNIESNLSVSSDEIRFSDIKGFLDGTHFTASVNRPFVKNAAWGVNVNIDPFTLNRYIPEKTRTASNLSELVKVFRPFNINGKIKCTRLSLYKIPHESFNLSFVLKNGILTADPIKANVFDGEIIAGITLEIPTAHNATKIALEYEVKDVDLEKFCKEQQIANAPIGKVSFHGNFQGNMRSTDEVPAAFSGTWALNIKGDTTKKKSLQLYSVGTMTNGVVSNPDLQITSKDFSAQGHGSIDLVKKTLDYHLSVAMMGLSHIPVHYYGKLDSPERNINATKAISGALSQIGSGVIDLLGGVIKTPLRLLKP